MQKLYGESNLLLLLLFFLFKKKGNDKNFGKNEMIDFKKSNIDFILKKRGGGGKERINQNKTLITIIKFSKIQNFS